MDDGETGEAPKWLCMDSIIETWEAGHVDAEACI